MQANIKGMFASKEAANEVFNVACGERISVNDLWEHLSAAAGSDIQPQYGPPRQGDVRDSLADISKARRLLGYEPEVLVQEGLQRTWEWFSSVNGNS